MPSTSLFLQLLLACQPGDADGPDDDADAPTDADADVDVDADADTDTDTDTDTAGPTTSYGAPTAVGVTCEPTGNPLRFACAVTVEPPQPVTLTWSRVDGLGPARDSASDEALAAHDVPLVFLAPEQEYAVVASATAWPAGLTADTNVTAGRPPSDVHSWLEMTGASTMGLLGTEAPCSTDAVAVVYDTSTGDLVWYHDLDPNGSLSVLDMVRFTADRTVIGETGERIVEVDLMGADLARFPVSYPGCCSLNHDIFEADGLYISQYQHTTGGFGGLTLDDIVAIDATGVEQWVWHPADHLDVPGNAGGDYLHTNSEYVDASGDLYLSWLTQDSIAKIEGDRSDPTWGTPLWILSGRNTPGDLGSDIVLDWSAVGGADSFGTQHNAHLRHDGRLMLLDNDHGRGLVISIDEQAGTGTVDAAYDTREGVCGPQGTAMDTVAGNAVVACSTPWVREYDLATSAMIWEAEIVCPMGSGGGWTPGGASRWYPLDDWN
jgi:hypothetical protein